MKGTLPKSNDVLKFAVMNFEYAARKVSYENSICFAKIEFKVRQYVIKLH